MGLISEHDANDYEFHTQHINGRWKQLYELQKEWGERGIRYLMVVNSGGAVTTLSFLGASSASLGMVGAKSALFFFVVGIILVGITTARTYHHMAGLFSNYKADVTLYFGNQISWEDMNERDKQRTNESMLDYVIVYSSFGCFLLGVISGACALFG